MRTATAFDVTARSEASEARTATSSYRSNWITPAGHGKSSSEVQAPPQVSKMAPRAFTIAG